MTSGGTLFRLVVSIRRGLQSIVTVRAMRPSILLASTAVVLLAIAACTSSSDLPDASGDCVVVDGSLCKVSVIGGGSSSGSEGGAEAGSCSVSAGDSQCGICATDDCCSEVESCSASSACTNLLNCEDDCSGGSGCVSACEAQFPTGVGTLQNLSSCLTTRCPICTESGTGDPCSPGYYACEPSVGLTCNGLYCTKGCVKSSDCTGIGAGGANSLGYGNACIATTHGDGCEPGCGGSANGCADFPGTYCYVTTDVGGASVSVCTALPDASTGD